jgi:hypothetical protein
MPLSESQKGRIVEQLVGATLMLQSDGRLRVSLPLVDDEGIDLLVTNRLNDKTLFLQIKSRFVLEQGRYRSNVRRATCPPNPSKFLLFVYYEKISAAIGETCWLIRASDFCQLLSNQRETRPDYIFNSSFNSKNDMWTPFRFSVRKLATEIEMALK